MLDSVTETCVVPVSKDKVFQFLSNVENLPKWSTQFVKKLTVVNGKQKAVTPIGEVFLRYETNPIAGLIDIYAGVDEQLMTPAYLRIIPFSDNSTGVMFTFFKWDGTDDATWQIFCKWIKIEVGNIKKYFS
ncbi:MAG TPA: SRPBCC family protein [Candidatus Nitrosotalea sp.]|nr:SRPBCC family protein [Candidatus Nitrosotalea sp.]